MRFVPVLALLAALGACATSTPASVAPDSSPAEAAGSAARTDCSRPKALRTKADTPVAPVRAVPVSARGEGLPDAIDDFLSHSPSWPNDMPLLALAEGEAADTRDAPQGDTVTKADLARKTQNPISDLISLPIQNNTGFNYGYDNDVQNVTNIQPVYPVSLNENWNLMWRIYGPLQAWYDKAWRPGEIERVDG